MDRSYERSPVPQVERESVVNRAADVGVPRDIPPATKSETTPPQGVLIFDHPPIDAESIPSASIPSESDVDQIEPSDNDIDFAIVVDDGSEIAESTAIVDPSVDDSVSDGRQPATMIDTGIDPAIDTNLETDSTQSLVRRSWTRRIVGAIVWTTTALFDASAWVVIIAVLAAAPVLQLLAYGYLLRCGGWVAAGGRVRDSIVHVRAAGRMGLAAAALFFAAMPSRLFAHYEAVSQIIEPGSARSTVMRILAITCASAALLYLLWAWSRGGRLWHYAWPEPGRFFTQVWRPSFWMAAVDRLGEFVSDTRPIATFWLGLRAAAGTLVWLIPAMVIVAALRNGRTGVEGLIGTLALFSLGLVLLYLPMLQICFAATGRLRDLFNVRQIRTHFRAAPLAWTVAMLFGLLLLPLPLYLLRIEATPRDVVWAPCLLFAALMLPARVVEGWALRRAKRRLDDGGVPSGWGHRLLRWVCRGLNVTIVATYLLVVFVSQYTSWDGLATWIAQHAVLLPVPFFEGT